MIGQAEYIWLDGTQPTQGLRSKTRIVNIPVENQLSISDFPVWSFDGSSTNQSSGNNSDLYLQPVRFVHDPIRGNGNYLVMCEVLDDNFGPHPTNSRAKLRKVLDNGAAAHEPWFGFEQEYTFFYHRDPLGWPEGGFPAPQGPFYCGVGGDKVYGRSIVEAHAKACIEAGLLIYGINAEVMPGQWEFQIGHRNFDREEASPLLVADHLWFARWLLSRIAEDYKIIAVFDPKPVRGDWNGAGAHTNFSTKGMRGKDGIKVMYDAISSLEKNHEAHIAVYGANLAERLTGSHETCSIKEFKAGVANRHASVRIPRHVEKEGSGYLEDRRPGANCDPYMVCARILETVTNIKG